MLGLLRRLDSSQSAAIHMPSHAQNNFPKPGTKVPAPKETLEARVGKQACGINYFKT
jgi:hypothetical protein